MAGQDSADMWTICFFFFQAEDGIRYIGVTGVQTCALPIYMTELREAQETLEQTREALFRSQKMETVGQLTGGLAHDFNNLLAVILGNLELLRLHLKNDAHANELIDAVVRAALHGQELTASLLAFARRRQLNPEPVDINALIENVVRLLSRTLA